MSLYFAVALFYTNISKTTIGLSSCATLIFFCKRLATIGKVINQPLGVRGAYTIFAVPVIAPTAPSGLPIFDTVTIFTLVVYS